MLEPIGKILKNKKTPPPSQRKKRFLVRQISKEILVNGFTKIPNAIILDPGLSCQDLRVLLVLDFHSKNKISCWPSHKTISKEACCTTRTVKRSLKNLKKLHYIDWKRTKLTNVYTLNYKIQNTRRH